MATLSLFIGTLRSAQFTHNFLLKNIMHAPMEFFDQTPIGRIINRFSKDIQAVDSDLPATLRACSSCLFSVHTYKSYIGSMFKIHEREALWWYGEKGGKIVPERIFMRKCTANLNRFSVMGAFAWWKMWRTVNVWMCNEWMIWHGETMCFNKCLLNIDSVDVDVCWQWKQLSLSLLFARGVLVRKRREWSGCDE